MNYLWASEIDVDASGNLVVKRTGSYVVTVTFYSDKTNKRLGVWYFDTCLGLGGIVERAWGLLFEKYPNIENRINSGDSIVSMLVE